VSSGPQLQIRSYDLSIFSQQTGGATAPRLLRGLIHYLGTTFIPATLTGFRLLIKPSGRSGEGECLLILRKRRSRSPSEWQVSAQEPTLAIRRRTACVSSRTSSSNTTLLSGAAVNRGDSASPTNGLSCSPSAVDHCSDSAFGFDTSLALVARAARRYGTAPVPAELLHQLQRASVD
jgi:hypothetical protein